MLLSVLSAMARLDLDPWQEAATLARLPGEAATARLASLISALPDEPSAHPDPRTIAARLIALLPRPSNLNISSRATQPGAGAATDSRTIKFVILYMIFMASLIGIQSAIASRHPPAHNDASPASSTVSPQIPPPSSGRSRGDGLG